MILFETIVGAAFSNTGGNLFTVGVAWSDTDSFPDMKIFHIALCLILARIFALNEVFALVNYL